MAVTSVVVDSRDRDRALYPTSQAYVVRLNDELKDVVSAELRQAIYDSSTASAGGGYACVIVEELRPTQVATNTRVRESCALLHLGRAVLDNQTFAVECPVVSSRISKLTVRFVDSGGDPIDLGEHLLRFDVRVAPPPPTGDANREDATMEPWARRILGIQGSYTKSDLNRAFYKINDGTEAPKVAYRVLRDRRRR